MRMELAFVACFLPWSESPRILNSDLVRGSLPYLSAEHIQHVRGGNVEFAGVFGAVAACSPLPGTTCTDLQIEQEPSELFIVQP